MYTVRVSKNKYKFINKQEVKQSFKYKATRFTIMILALYALGDIALTVNGY